MALVPHCRPPFSLRNEVGMVTLRHTVGEIMPVSMKRLMGAVAERLLPHGAHLRRGK